MHGSRKPRQTSSVSSSSTVFPPPPPLELSILPLPVRVLADVVAADDDVVACTQSTRANSAEKKYIYHAQYFWGKFLHTCVLCAHGSRVAYKTEGHRTSQSQPPHLKKSPKHLCVCLCVCVVGDRVVTVTTIVVCGILCVRVCESWVYFFFSQILG